MGVKQEGWRNYQWSFVGVLIAIKCAFMSEIKGSQIEAGRESLLDKIALLK